MFNSRDKLSSPALAVAFLYQLSSALDQNEARDECAGSPVKNAGLAYSVSWQVNDIFSLVDVCVSLVSLMSSPQDARDMIGE
jgi:hypothetical protein